MKTKKIKKVETWALYDRDVLLRVYQTWETKEEIIVSNFSDGLKLKRVLISPIIKRKKKA